MRLRFWQRFKIMKTVFTKPFLNNFAKLSVVTKRKFRKQLGFLIQDVGYPSLHAKKYDEKLGVWQARVDDNFRFYFQIKKDTYFILNIIKHPK